MVASRMHIGFSFGTGPLAADDGARPTPRDPDAPLRLLVLADLGGSQRRPLAERRPLRVDIDSFDTLFARLQPALTLDVDGMACAWRLQGMDDFHPDALFARLPGFEALRRLRRELEDPASFRGVAAAMGWGDEAPRAVAPAAPQRAPQGPDELLNAWMREQVAPHVLPGMSHEQRGLRDAAEQSLGALMRRVLHEPRLQALEATWRGLHRLVRELDLDQAVHLSVLDMGRDELAADLAAAGEDLTCSALHRVLLEPGGADAPRPNLLLLDQAFGPEAADLQMLAALGALAARCGAPLVAQALPALAGCSGWPQDAEPRQWLPEDAPELAHWAALRGSPQARWLGLVLPRVLMRLPYGAATDAVDSFAFEEMPPGPRAHEAYLWGLAPLALALLAGQAFMQGGWPLPLRAHTELTDLPSHVHTEDGQTQQQPCAELLLTERAADALAQRGLMALQSWRDRAQASLHRWQSVASPAAPLGGLGG